MNISLISFCPIKLKLVMTFESLIHVKYYEEYYEEEVE